MKRRTPVWISLVFVGLMALLGGCRTTGTTSATSPLIHEFQPNRIESANLNAVFRLETFSDTANKIGHPIAETEHHAIIAAQIRDREKPHLHERHDLIVYLHRGQGKLKTPGHETTLNAGDWTIVRQGVPHQFVNTGDRPAQAVVIRTPNPEERDYEPLETLEQ
jgi:mannose-6-phosphate isomerase-like protein (cupin superfamily)